MAEWIRPWTSIPEVPGSNPSPAVVPLGKALLTLSVYFIHSLSSPLERTLSC